MGWTYSSFQHQDGGTARNYAGWSHPTGEQIGVIQRLMIDKLSGQIAYAVLSFGGFLGFGQKHFPVPWRSLKYNPKHGAYEFEVTEEQLRAAPSFTPGEEFDWGDRSDKIQILVRHYPVHHGWE
jgi:hypothetical protein